MNNVDARAHRASRASEIIENEVFQETFKLIEDDLIESWKNTKPADAAGRETLHLQLQMLKKVELVIKSTMETGKLAQAEKKWLQRVKDAITP